MSEDKRLFIFKFLDRYVNDLLGAVVSLLIAAICYGILHLYVFYAWVDQPLFFIIVIKYFVLAFIPLLSFSGMCYCLKDAIERFQRYREDRYWNARRK